MEPASETVGGFGDAEPTDPLAAGRMLANVRERLFGTAAAPPRVGPYEIVRRLGAGAMGTVFEAYDPRLRRRIAVKVVRTRAVEQRRRSAMLREAQALARLGHPNVVAIYDAGIEPGMVWVAMELLHGQDLQAWIAGGEHRSLPDTLAVLREVAGGLVAVHAVGLVHRDVKPSNAFRTDEGRVCLVDFGLAIEADAGPAALTRSFDVASSMTAPISSVTSMCIGAGTPAYMAPEQHRGEAATAASDQYAFCIVAWEAIYGVRPFLATTADGLYLRKLDARLSENPPRAGVDERVHRVLLRGLAADPDARWPSMRELVAALFGDHPPRRRAPAIAVSLGAVALVAGLAAAAPKRGRVCTDERATPWTARERAAVEAALLGDGSAMRHETWERVAPRLDAQARELVEAEADICRAVGTDDLDEQLADRRFACLARERAELAALVDTLRGGETQVVTNATEWAAGLEDPQRCATLQPTADASPLPPPAVATDVERLRERLRRAKSELQRGALDDALTIAMAVLPEADALGFPALVAETDHAIGRIQRARRDWESAESFLTKAYFEARAARDAETELLAAIEMIHIYVAKPSPGTEALDWLERARAADVDPSLDRTVGLLMLEAMILTSTDDDRRAAEVLREAHGLAAGLAEDDPVALSVGSGMVLALNNVNEFEESLGLAREHLALRTRLLGAEHPSNAVILHNLAIAAWELGEVDESRAAFERSLELERHHRGPRSYDVGIGLLEVGRRATVDGDLVRAQTALDEGCAIMTESVGADHPGAISCLLTLGDLALAAGRLGEASTTFDRVRVLAETSTGTDSPLVGLALSGHGRVQLAEGRVDEARVTLERARALLESGEPEGDRTLEFGELCLALADATWRSGGSRDDALALARTAAPPRPSNPATQALARRVTQWLREHEGEP